jgi:23S rRNA (pseudouridine1915-N3)-methyltransferase
VAAWLRLVTVGVPGRGPYRELEDDFLARISRYTRYERQSVAASRRRSPAARRQEEAERVERVLRGGGATVALDQRGRALDSPAFGEALRGWRDTGGVTLLVGGPDGHATELLGRADARIALGPMTLPHELAWIVLLEQIYRALAAEHNHPYAKH